MKSIIFIVFIFFYSTCFAQITITESDMPAVGDTLRLSNALLPQSANIAQTGANYTWNFSQLLPIIQHIDTFFYMSALSKSYQITFSGASFVTHTTTPDSNGSIGYTNVYTIYQLSSSTYDGLGVGEKINGIPTPIKYDSADILYSFPLNYSNVYSSHTGYAVSISSIANLSEKKKTG